MSRKVEEDFSHLARGERMSKMWAGFRTWVYNPEDKTIMGERVAKQWGMLLGYYFIFYAILAAFTAIFFAILDLMSPAPPFQVVSGICSDRPNARDPCGAGPFFQALDLSELTSPGVEVYTDEIFKFSLCEPAIISIPRSLSLTEPPVGYNFDYNRRGYTQFNLEAARLLCQAPYNNPTFNPECSVYGNTNLDPINNGGRPPASNSVNVLPLIPKQVDQGFMNATEIFDNAIPAMSGGLSEYKKPYPVYTFERAGTNPTSYSVYMIFLRFNKVWNYQPYHNERSLDVSSPKTAEDPIENNIGVQCSFENSCSSGTSINYNGDEVPCDAQSSASGAMRMDLLSNVMTNFDGFPWRGGELNMNFASIAVTVRTGEPVQANTISCSMGVDVTNGISGIGSGSSPTGIPATARSIFNFEKMAYERIYTRSKGRNVEIEIS